MNLIREREQFDMSVVSAKNTKEQLAAAARDLLIREGLGGFSMRKVAASCGVSATAIYRHYADKDELLASAVTAGFRTFASYLRTTSEDKGAAARFRTFLTQYLAFALENQSDYRLIFLMDYGQLDLRKLKEVSRLEAADIFQKLRERISECQIEGYFQVGDPREIAAFVWSSVHGLASLLLRGNLGAEPEQAQRLVDVHLAHLERALRP